MPIDMSSRAVTTRLKRVSELRRLCLALAGPRLKWDWRRTSADVPQTVHEDRNVYEAGKKKETKERP